MLDDIVILKLNSVKAESTQSNESDNFLPVVSEDDLSTGPPQLVHHTMPDS